jgi:hypothetical protein
MLVSPSDIYPGISKLSHDARGGGYEAGYYFFWYNEAEFEHPQQSESVDNATTNEFRSDEKVAPILATVPFTPSAVKFTSS